MIDDADLLQSNSLTFPLQESEKDKQSISSRKTHSARENTVLYYTKMFRPG